jgi:hypothetical protein
MKPKRILALGAVGSMAFACTALADAEPASRPSPEPGFSLTIYSNADPGTFDPADYARQETLNSYYSLQNPLPGYGVVRENRLLSLDPGDDTLRFTDVATGIDPTTVSFQSLTAPDAASVLEQNYEYDLVSADKLLDKYLDKTISISRRGEQENAPAETIKGKLLSFDAANLVLEDESAKVLVLSRGSGIQSIELERPDAGLITKPTLVWKVHNTLGGEQLAQVTYQTSGITWRADYNVTLNPDDNAADVGAWVTILNQSGAAYPDAHLKLVAGDVQRVRPPQQVMDQVAMESAATMSANAPAGFAEKSFFEYHLYTLGRTTSLSNNSTKQIELFDSKLAVPVSKIFVYYGLQEQWRNWVSSSPATDQNLGVESNKKVDVYIQMRNSEKNGLGIPLPAGRIRVYKKDAADGAKEFIGEDIIQHTPRDEDVLMKLGTAFDIVGERKQTDFKVNYDRHTITESFEIKIRNHKKEPVHVIVKENLYRCVNWEITASSDGWEKQDFRTIHFPVDVPVDGQKTVTYTVHYTW